MKVLRKIFIIGLCSLLVLTAVAAAFFLITTKDSKLNEEKLTLSENNIVICDNGGNEIAQISANKANKSVKIEALSDHLKNAFVSIEDKNFYKHHGLDVARMGKAFFNNLKSRSYKEGASTISQQLIKNTHLTNEKTISRKLKEIKLTVKLEKKYSKDEIMEMYLNTIYFGHSCFGIASAADFYFDKEAKDLTVAESALLAALIKAPNTYSPFNHPEKCLQRRNLVLTKMQEYGYLSESEAKIAKESPIPEKSDNAIKSQTYIQSVYDELENVLSVSPYAILDGCRIYTYMDAPLQKYAEELKTTADRSGKSIVILDNKTRGVKAFYSTEGNSSRQPGSIIKPLAVYAPAFEENRIVPATPILDEKIDFGGYSPSNYNDVYNGYVSARAALSRSLNVPAVKILNDLGIEKSEHYLREMNLPLKDEDKHLALALGGMSRGYTLTQLAGAYTVFANEGFFAQPRFIKKLEDSRGNVLYTAEIASRKVFGKDTVGMINDILYETAKTGTAKKLSNLPFPVCAKTATCGTEKGNTDSYTISYTPEDTVAVWMGNYDNTVTDVTGGGLPCHYAYLLHKKIYADSAPSHFEVPGELVSLKLDKFEYENNHRIVLADEYAPTEYVVTDLFKSDKIPQESSARFTSPQIQTPSIRYKDGNVIIDLCHAEYYSYLIKRQYDSKTETIYDGKYQEHFTDRNTVKNKKYTYTVTPYVKNSEGDLVYGKSVVLPTVYTKSKQNYDKILDDILD